MVSNGAVRVRSHVYSSSTAISKMHIGLGTRIPILIQVEIQPAFSQSYQDLEHSWLSYFCSNGLSLSPSTIPTLCPSDSLLGGSWDAREANLRWRCASHLAYALSSACHGRRQEEGETLSSTCRTHALPVVAGRAGCYTYTNIVTAMIHP